MRQSTLHVGIIMDGNGRWASERELPRVAGHRAGADAVRRAVESATELGIGTLTLFAFSSDNWLRPTSEVSFLMRLFLRFIRAETPRCAENGIRLGFIGRRDRIDPRLVAAMNEAESRTSAGKRMLLRIAVDYSARAAIQQAAARGGESFAEALAVATNAAEVIDRVDLVIRTGREKRISDFLLWEAAYAELYFIDTMWPDFTRDDLVAAVDEYWRRERRFGRTPQQYRDLAEVSHG